MNSRGEGRRVQRGFTLVEILVAVLIVALLVAITVPIVTGRLALAHADSIVSEMQNLQQALVAFHRDVGRYPARLDYLDVLPTSGVVDACNVAISAQNQAKFRGPYINRQIVMVNPGAGITKYVLATDDSVDATLTRTTITNPVTGGTQQVLQINVYGVPQDITRMVDSTTDGIVDGNNGIVQYGALLPTGNTISWNIPIKNGAC